MDRLKCILLAILGFALIAFAYHADQRDVTEPPSVAWEDLDAAQLSWVIEGIQERIGALQHDLVRAQALQQEKMSLTAAG